MEGSVLPDRAELVKQTCWARGLFSGATTPELRVSFALEADTAERIDFASGFQVLQTDGVSWPALRCATSIMDVPKGLSWAAFRDMLALVDSPTCRPWVTNPLVGALVDFRGDLRTAGCGTLECFDLLLRSATASKMGMSLWQPDTDWKLDDAPQEHWQPILRALTKLFAARPPQWVVSARDRRAVVPAGGATAAMGLQAAQAPDPAAAAPATPAAQAPVAAAGAPAAAQAGAPAAVQARTVAASSSEATATTAATAVDGVPAAEGAAGAAEGTANAVQVAPLAAAVPAADAPALAAAAAAAVGTAAVAPAAAGAPASAADAPKTVVAAALAGTESVTEALESGCSLAAAARMLHTGKTKEAHNFIVGDVVRLSNTVGKRYHNKAFNTHP